MRTKEPGNQGNELGERGNHRFGSPSSSAIGSDENRILTRINVESETKEPESFIYHGKKKALRASHDVTRVRDSLGRAWFRFWWFQGGAA